MAKIALRAYNREVETLIEQGHIDEAIAHCRHILRTFPKCLDTYRLLGKAYLEAKRFAEAEDILKRLLLAVPDDFIGNLGMSIISDEQKSVNNAIWYMERAFEVQPANTAVQSELRRLYGRRDGLEPPQIRLTRGALAQMYARGNQIQQAIAEIRAILADDPGRMDLQVLLARVYFRGGQKVEATDACTDLLKKYPYCLDANRIMVEILSEASRSDGTHIYRHRVNALEPYAAFVPGSLFDVADVPEQAVLLERLDFEAGEFTSPSDFGYQTAEPPAAEAPAEEHEAWRAETPVEPEAPAEVPAAEEAEQIPDWLKAAGWGAATAEAVRRSDQAAHEKEGAGEVSEQAADELAAAEVPDWLKSMAPPEAAQAATPETASVEPDMDWLAGLGLPEESKPEPGTEATQVSLSSAAVAAAAAAAAVGLHKEEEAKAEEAPAPAEAQAEVPAGVQELPESAEAIAEPSTDQAATQPVRPAPPVTEAEEEAPPQAAMPAGEAPPSVAAMAAVAMMAAAPHEEAPEETPAMENAMPSEEEVPDDVTAWLAGLDAGEGKVEQPEEPSAVEPAPAEMAVPASEVPVEQETPKTVEEMNPDEAFAWLESLAVKQGANPEELLTKPEEPPAAEGPGLAGTIAAGAIAGLAGAALSRDEEAPSEEPAAVVPEAAAGEAEAAIPEVVAGETEATVPEAAASEDLDWLEGIEKEGEVEEPSAQVPPATEWLPEEAAAEEALAPSEVPAEPVVERAEPAEEEIPEWLRPALEETTPEAASDEMPDWLRAVAGLGTAGVVQSASEERAEEWMPEEAAAPEATPAAETPGLAEMMTGSTIGIARPTPPQADDAIFEQAQIDLQRGNLDQAAAGYSRLIKRGKLLDEIIYDLREASYRFPVDVII